MTGRQIPDGYTFTRCDIYTEAEFRERMSGRYWDETVNQYIAENPKDTYNTDDEIAVRYKRDERYVGSRCRTTTKRYKFREQAQNNE